MARVLYATVDHVRDELKVEDADANQAGDDWIVNVALPQISARIEHVTGKEFAPRIATRRFHGQGVHIDDLYNALVVSGNPVLEVLSVSIDGTTISSDGYQFVNPESPYNMIALTSAAEVQTWYTANADWLNAIALEAVFGWRYRYPSEGWVATGQTVQNNPLDDSSQTVQVASVAGFAIGQLLRLEDEFVLVTALDTGANELTVIRGHRGSEASSHVQGIAIELWEPEPEIVRAATRWAMALYKMRGSIETVQIDTFGGVATKLPQDAPAEVWHILSEFGNYGVSTGE